MLVDQPGAGQVQGLQVGESRQVTETRSIDVRLGQAQGLEVDQATQVDEALVGDELFPPPSSGQYERFEVLLIGEVHQSLVGQGPFREIEIGPECDGVEVGGQSVVVVRTGRELQHQEVATGQLLQALGRDSRIREIQFGQGLQPGQLRQSPIGHLAAAVQAKVFQ